MWQPYDPTVVMKKTGVCVCVCSPKQHTQMCSIHFPAGAKCAIFSVTWQPPLFTRIGLASQYAEFFWCQKRSRDLLAVFYRVGSLTHAYTISLKPEGMLDHL